MLQLTDARTLAHGDRLEADYCIVGAGVAGLTLAAGLASSGRRVLLLESGARESSASAQALNRGRAHLSSLYRAGEPYLEKSRVRGFGGTATEWRHECGAIDGIELEARPWIDHSGWPIDRSELAGYVERAQNLLGVAGDEPAATELPDWDEAFEITWLRNPQEESVTALLEPALAGASDIEVLTHANATEIVVDPAAGRVIRIRARCLEGPELTVSAGSYVLAAGALESARLMLASNRVRPLGIGNEHDRVGRYFMDQIECQIGTLLLPGLAARMRPFHSVPTARGFEARAHWRPSAKLQRRHELLASTLRLGRLDEATEPPLTAEVESLARETATAGERVGSYHATVTLVVEPRPDPRNRVTLGEDRDPLGMPRIDLEWTDHEYEAWTLRATSHLLAEAVGRSLAGRLYLPRIRRLPRYARPRGCHACTTRMSRDPEHGVVDLDCRVHSVPNLFVAGSGVFPTLGSRPPMLTAMAMALRLADHLVRES